MFAMPVLKAFRLRIDPRRYNGASLLGLQGIVVNNEGNSFTSLRIGVATANALAFALNIPVVAKNGQKEGRFVAPKYSQEPNITVESKK